MNITLPAGDAGAAYSVDLPLTGTAPFSLSSFTGGLAAAGFTAAVVETSSGSGVYVLRVAGTLPDTAQTLTGQAIVSNCDGGSASTADLSLEVAGGASGYLATLAELNATTEGSHVSVLPGAAGAYCGLDWYCDSRMGAGLSALDGSAAANPDQRIVAWFVGSRCSNGSHTATNAMLCIEDIIADGYVQATGQWERIGSAAPHSGGENPGYGDQWRDDYGGPVQSPGSVVCGSGRGRVMSPSEPAGHWHGLFSPGRAALPPNRYSKLVTSVTGHVVSSDGNPINGTVCLMLSAASDLYRTDGAFNLTYVNDIMIGAPKAMLADGTKRIAFSQLGFANDTERQAYIDWRNANYPD